MGTDLNNKEPIIPEMHEAMLQNLQGNILKGHGRGNSVHIFLALNKPANEVRVHLAKLANDRVITSAWEQHIQGKRHKEDNISDEMFGNLFLTARGYKNLGFDPTELPKATNYFLKGMTNPDSVNALDDPDPNTWEPRYKDGLTDAMVLLANMKEDVLKREAETLMTKLRAFSEILTIEWGNVLQNEAQQPIEHFGHVDGISQPIFLSTDTDLPTPANRKEWDPTAPLGLVLVEDRLAKGKNCYGSYLVFRKLEQKVIPFKIGIARLAQELEDKSGLKVDPQHVRAMMVGRFEDGTPLAQSATAIKTLDNNFRYTTDPTGLKCPVFAHARKTNPRNGTERRIARRAISYGIQPTRGRFPAGPVGLLFMCFQASLDAQFVHIQQQANNPDDLDPIIGQSPRARNPASRNWPIHWGQGSIQREFDTSWVELKGGEYFFAPSIPFLMNL